MGDNLPQVDPGTGHEIVGYGMGNSHQCYMLDDGRVKCTGYNLDGRLGYGDTATHSGGTNVGDGLPTIDLGTGRTAVSLTVAENHACAGLAGCGKSLSASLLGQSSRGGTRRPSPKKRRFLGSPPHAGSLRWRFGGAEKSFSAPC